MLAVVVWVLVLVLASVLVLVLVLVSVLVSALSRLQHRAVSYTHLDVYKRQAQKHPAQDVAGVVISQPWTPQ